MSALQVRSCISVRLLCGWSILRQIGIFLRIFAAYKYIMDTAVTVWHQPLAKKIIQFFMFQFTHLELKEGRIKVQTKSKVCTDVKQP